MNSSLNPIAFAMRHPVRVMAGVVALAVASALAVQRMAVDVFPALDLPVIYIAQPYGGMDPSQMESQLNVCHRPHSGLTPGNADVADRVGLPARRPGPSSSSRCHKAARTPVRLGLRDRQRVEVLRKQRHSVGQGIAAEWEDFTDTDLVVRDNPSTFAHGQEITIRPEGSSVATVTADP